MANSSPPTRATMSVWRIRCLSAPAGFIPTVHDVGPGGTTSSPRSKARRPQRDVDGGRVTPHGAPPLRGVTFPFVSTRTSHRPEGNHHDHISEQASRAIGDGPAPGRAGLVLDAAALPRRDEHDATHRRGPGSAARDTVQRCAPREISAPYFRKNNALSNVPNVRAQPMASFGKRLRSARPFHAE